MPIIYHLADAAAWAAARMAGSYQGTADDRRDGFIHFSTAGQVRESAARHRRGVAGLLLVAVDADRLGAALKWEPARGGQLFPHLHAPLDPALAISAVPLPLGADGLHVFPDDLP
ncbi:MAG: DUF952 domain-containing protein [Alphaproteobacteria bacterium]|nr:DUF952 domain-containing protein [Alphaproteobacteria bacterium]